MKNSISQEICPKCGKLFDGEYSDEFVDPNDGQDDGYGHINVWVTCPHCGKESKAVFGGSGWDFLGWD